LRIHLREGMQLSNRLKTMEKFDFYCPIRDEDVRLESGGIDTLLKSKLMEFCGVQIIRTIK